MGKWSIGKIEFASKEDYKAACRDLKRIQTLAAGVELDDFKEAAELYDMLKKQPFLFESELGTAFRSYLSDKADGILHPRGSFPEECLSTGKAAKKKKPDRTKTEPSGGKTEKDAKNAMRAGREKLRERDIGREREEKEPVFGGRTKEEESRFDWKNREEESRFDWKNREKENAPARRNAGKESVFGWRNAAQENVFSWRDEAKKTNSSRTDGAQKSTFLWGDDEEENISSLKREGKRNRSRRGLSDKQKKGSRAPKSWEEDGFESGRTEKYRERKTFPEAKGLNEFNEFDDISDGRKKRGKVKNRSTKTKGRILRPVLIIAGLCLILFALYQIFSYDILSYISARKMEELAACILTPIEPEVSEAHRIADLIASGLYTEEEAIEIAKNEQQENPAESVTEDGILYRYSVLYARNPEMAGWIQLAGTVINYPVMLTPQEEEYYLQRGFDKKYDINGIPFMDARCSVKEPTMNFLIYGHNMKNGSMFSALLSYEQEEFYKEHPTIRFDTVYARGEYEIVGVFQTQIPYESDKEAYRYYSFIDTEDEEEYNAYIRYVKEQSFYETGITAEYGTQLLTLSTCDRSVEAGRFVVVARKK